VELLFNGSNSVPPVFGVDETLVRLQEGLLRNIAVVRGLRASVNECTNCGWADPTPDSTCPACGGARLHNELRALLPRLAKRYKVPLDVVADDVGERLRQAGGIAARFK
jgi:hypothetical protein